MPRQQHMQQLTSADSDRVRSAGEKYLALLQGQPGPTGPAAVSTGGSNCGSEMLTRVEVLLQGKPGATGPAAKSIGNAGDGSEKPSKGLFKFMRQKQK